MANDITIIKTTQQQSDKGFEVCLKEENIRDQAKNARELFGCLQNELDEIEDDLKDGLSYLDMKNDTLLSYMIDLCNIILRKVRCEAISNHPSVERTVYYRVILEKIKAIDQRLAYQLNKVITMPDDAGEEARGIDINNLDVDLGSDDDQTEEAKGSSHKNSPHNDNEESDEDDVEDEDEGEDDGEDDGSVDSASSEQSEDDVDEDSEIEDEPVEKKDLKNARSGGTKKPAGVYKPPKLRSVAYDDGKSTDRARRRRDYNEFYQDDDYNHDIVEETRVHEDMKRTRYEEENYTRLPDANPKKVKRKARQAKLRGKKKFKSGGKRK